MSDIGLQIQAHQEAFRMNTVALEELLTGTQGPVALDLSQRAIRVESAAKENATGRPGPNVISGRLRGSITWRLGVDAEGLYAEIGTNVEYGRRIELGFTGVDSLGRTYDQPAYPFLLPALEAAHG